MNPTVTLNSRGHWTRGYRKTEHERAMLILVLGSRNPPPLPCVVTMVRQGVRTLDDDNLPGAFKKIRDQLAIWLGLPRNKKGVANDSDPRVTWRCEQEKVPRNRVGVVIRFEAREEKVA
jgi:hypothetical protein